MKPWKTLSRQTVLDHRPFLAVEFHKVELPNGKVISDWPWVITPDYVNVVAKTMDGHFLCFRQVKYAAQGVSLAPVGGYIDPGESPETAARRELLEETGYQSDNWISLGSYAVDANRGAGVAHFFAAQEARRISQPTGGDLEEQELLLLTREQIEAALAQGQFKILPWASAVAIALSQGL